MRRNGRLAFALLVTCAALAVERLVWPSYALPSITTVLVAGAPLWRRAGLSLSFGGRRTLLAILSVGGALYASAFGLLPFDVYAAGFSPLAPLAVAVVAALAARRAPAAAIVAAAGLVAFDVHLLASRNLFDYLVDPLLFAGVAAAVAMRRSPAGRIERGVTPAPEPARR